MWTKHELVRLSAQRGKMREMCEQSWRMPAEHITVFSQWETNSSPGSLAS